MAVTYKQTHGWREDGWGQITITFRLSDTYAGLFLAEESCLDTNVFLLDEVAKDVATKAGGLAEHELTFNIDEAAIYTANDIAAIALVKTARTPSNVVYAAVYIDTGTTPLVADMIYSGVIQPDEEAMDQKWYGSHYDQNPTPLRQWRIKSRPFSNAVMERFSLEELIDGTTDGPSEGVKYIDPISAAWETTNVFNGQGWYSKTVDGVAKTTKVNKLVPMNVTLRKLADQLEAGLLSKFNITMNINFDRSLMEGKWHPARWNKFDMFTQIPRWVGMQYNADTNMIDRINPYTIYPTDRYEMAIDPDNAAYALGGEPTKYEQLYISYRVIKLQLHSPAQADDESDTGGAKSLMWKTKCKTFTELIFKLALSLGCYAIMEMTDAQNISIKFIRRQSYAQSQLFLKTASDAKFKGSARPLDAGVNAKWQGRATQLALEGADIYEKDITATKSYLGPTEWSLVAIKQSDRYKEAKGDDLIVTIAPTVCEIVNVQRDGHIYEMKDINFQWTMARLPHNHYTADDGTSNTAYWQTAYGMHTALYMYVDKWGAHPDPNSVEAASYYTPVAAITVKKDRIDTVNHKFFTEDTYYSLSEYLNELLGFDTEYFNVEYNLDIPFYYGLSLNADGSNPNWRDLQLGSQIVLDGVTYIVEGIKYKLSESKISIRMSGSAKYNFDAPDATTVPDLTAPAQLVTQAPDTVVCTAYGTIAAGNYVYDRGDGTIDVMAETNTHSGKGIGIALNGGSATDLIYVKTAGIAYLPGQTFTAGSLVFIHTHVTNYYNFSHTALTAKAGANDLHCVIARAIGANEIELLKQPIEFIFP